MQLDEAIASRRSIRHFDPREVPPELVQELIAAACTAPAPHRTRPWRFIHVISRDSRTRLAEALERAWRADMERDGSPMDGLEARIARSRRQLLEAPVLLLACLALEGAHPWPDERRRRAERDMFMQSLGASLQNLLLAAHSRGLAAYLKGAPLFCPQAVASALQLPPGWEPAFFVLLGYPAQGFVSPPRPDLRLEDFLTRR